LNIIINIKALLQYKFVKDSAWTFISFIILAFSGVITNILIGNNFGPAGLGIFSQALALYMILSLIAVWGLNNSVLKYIAQYNSDTDVVKKIFTTAFILTTAFSIFLVLVLQFLAHRFPSIFFNKDVTKAASIIFLSLPFFALNKIFMALINALRHMKTYALIQSSRWILIILFIFSSIFLKKPLHFIFFSFLFTEIILLTYFLIFYLKYFSTEYKNSEWFNKHLIFGSKSVLLGFLSETNNKIDVFFISFFLSNYNVGVYSFAAEIARGLLSLGSVVQLNVNPIVSDLWEKRNKEALSNYTRQIMRLMFIILVSVMIAAAVIYPFFVRIVMKDTIYLESIPIFYILLPGVLMYGMYCFAGGYLSMANFLNTALLNLILIVTFNALSCALFIHFWGLNGAAIATSSTFAVTTLLLHFFVRKKMGINLI